MAEASETMAKKGQTVDPTPGGVPQRARLAPALVKELQSAMTQLLNDEEAGPIKLRNGGVIGRNKANDGFIINLPMPEK